jgi:hypothetical protein
MAASFATLIGDLVGSKRHRDRPGLQRRLEVVLRATNEVLQPVRPLELSVGDEFQGTFSDTASAAGASLLIRLQLLVDERGTDSRYGLGYGDVTLFNRQRSPASQDGPGWWSARDAIDRAKRLAESPRTSFVRTCFGYWEDELGPGVDAASMEAFLICRDATVDQMNDRQRRLLLGLLLGRPQTELAASEGITQGAVSQSLRHSGAFAIEAAHLRLEEQTA